MGFLKCLSHFVHNFMLLLFHDQLFHIFIELGLIQIDELLFESA